MESSDMKNMVVLKNLPSNMVEEAIVIFKENQKIREMKLIDKGRKSNLTETQVGLKECALKEAEMLVADYINKIEDKKNKKTYDRHTTLKYKSFKYYSIILTILFIVSLIVNFR